MELLMAMKTFSIRYRTRAKKKIIDQLSQPIMASAVRIVGWCQSINSAENLHHIMANDEWFKGIIARDDRRFVIVLISINVNQQQA